MPVTSVDDRNGLPGWLVGDSVMLSEKLLSRIPERFHSKIKVNSESGCWEWIAGLRRGYSRYWYQNDSVPGHRYSYEQVVGEIPDGLELDHLCRNLPCVNPFHLEPVTGWENRVARGTSMVAIFAAATHCKHGHPFDDANTYWRPTGGRMCKACGAARRAQRYQREKERHAA